MAKTKHILHQPIKNPWILAVIALIIIITFISLYINKSPRAGQAVSVGDAQWTGGTVNLEQEGTITFTVLPATSRAINFRMGTEVYDTTPAEYTFTLEKINTQNYKFTIYLSGTDNLLALDTLFVGGAEDRSLIHLDPTDAIPELEVLYQNNQVIIRNYHFIPPTRALILLQNSTTDLSANQVLPPVIRLPVNGVLQGNNYINASSIVAPEDVGMILIGGGTLNLVNTPTQDTRLNFTTRSFTYTAPTEPTAVLLDVNATVLGRVTHAYYTIAVGDRVYALLEDHFPRIIFRLDSTVPFNASNSQLIISLHPTLELQPLALPCDVTEPFSTLFAGKAVKKILTYRNGAPQVWTNQSPSDFTSFEPFQGYFVQLSEVEPTPTILTTHCTVNSTEPISSMPPSFTSSAQTPVQLTAGWNLFAMRGIVPRALSDFTTDTSFRVFECQQNYVCSEIPRTTSLNPGKPYWIYTANPLTINYWLR